MKSAVLNILQHNELGGGGGGALAIVVWQLEL